MDFADVGLQLNTPDCGDQSLRDAIGRGCIVQLEAFGIDEPDFVDNTIQLLMVANKF